jgi:DNA-binding NtrC family response regulator
MIHRVPPPLAKLHRARVLVAEDEPVIALDVAFAVEEAGGEVVGPAASVRQALSLVEGDGIQAAILDVDLLDGNVGPVIEELARRGIPTVIHSGAGVPAFLRDRFKDLAVYRKPTPPLVLVDHVAGRLKD